MSGPPSGLAVPATLAGPVEDGPNLEEANGAKWECSWEAWPAARRSP